MQNTIPPDPAFPSLPELLPRRGAPALVARMVQQMSGVPVRADRGRIRCFDYRPNRHCIISWSFPTASGPMIASGTLFQDGAYEKVINNGALQHLAENVAAFAGLNGRAFDYSPQHRLLLQIFPLDYELPGLLCAANQAWVSGLSHATRERRLVPSASRTRNWWTTSLPGDLYFVTTSTTPGWLSRTSPRSCAAGGLRSSASSASAAWTAPAGSCHMGYGQARGLLRGRAGTCIRSARRC